MWGWLVAAVLPLAKKVLIGLGIGTLTYVGVDALIGQLQVVISNNFGAVSADISAILAISGLFDAVGIMLGGIAGRAALVATSRLGSVL